MKIFFINFCLIKKHTKINIVSKQQQMFYHDIQQEKVWKIFFWNLLNWIDKNIDSSINTYSDFNSELIHQLHLHNLFMKHFLIMIKKFNKIVNNVIHEQYLNHTETCQ